MFERRSRAASATDLRPVAAHWGSATRGGATTGVHLRLRSAVDRSLCGDHCRRFGIVAHGSAAEH